MATNKPTKPSETLPASFGGLKENFSASKISTGYEPDTPDILGGANLNYWIDAQGKKFTYNDVISDYMVAIPVNNFPFVNSNNKFDNKSLNDIVQTTGNQTIGGVKTFSNTIQGTISNAVRATQDGNGDVIDETYIKFSNMYETMNNSKALETGAMSNDATIYADIYRYAHSTFDLSKFTVFGTPNITDDSVVSGFSVNDYAKTPIINASGNIEDIWLKLKWNGALDNDTNKGILRKSTTNLWLFINRSSNGNELGMRQNTTWGSEYLDINFGMASHLNEWLTVNINLNKITQKLTMNIYDESGVLIATGNRASTCPTLFNDYYELGRTASYFDTGSIDLRYFAMYADGIPVFNGNKTGIDTIKPNDYTVAGTPNITDDGIASGFSSSNYLYSPAIDLSTANSWKIRIKADYIPEGTSDKFLIGNKTTSAQKILLGRLNTTGNLFFRAFDTDGTQIVNVNIAMGANLTGFVEIGFNGTQYYITRTLADGTTNTSTADSTTKTGQNGAIYMGYDYNGTIDLNSIEVYVDGNLVYQPCLKIPYTESAKKYGSKIVDIAYRNRVLDAYEQGYPQRYYVIDEANQQFALHCGEIYGMFEQIKTQLAVDITDNGTTHIEKYPDGRLYMSGRYTWKTSSTSVPFVQPVLSANGTPGGANFAVFSGGELFPTAYPACKAFDGNPSTFYESSNVNPAYIGFYNPEKLNVTALTVTNAIASRETTTYAIEASDDGITWTAILTGSSSARGAGSQFIVNLSSNTNSYYYYRLRSTGIAYGWCVAEIKITATYEDSGSPTINRIILPVTTTNNYYNPVLTGINADISGVYPSSVNTGYIDLTGSASNNDVIGWSVHAMWM